MYVYIHYIAAGDKGTYVRSEEQLDLARARVTVKQSVLINTKP